MFKPDTILKFEVPRRPEDVSVAIRFPSDEQIIERAKGRKRIITTLGRAGHEERDSITFSDSELLRTLHAKDGEPETLTDAEATRIINTLLNITVIDCEKVGSKYVLRYESCFGSDSVELLTPTADELETFASQLAVVRSITARQQSTYTNLTAAQALWSLVGPPAPLPVVWKAQLLLELHGHINDLATRRQDPT